MPKTVTLDWAEYQALIQQATWKVQKEHKASISDYIRLRPKAPSYWLLDEHYPFDDVDQFGCGFTILKMLTQLSSHTDGTR